MAVMEQWRAVHLVQVWVHAMVEMMGALLADLRAVAKVSQKAVAKGYLMA